MMQIIRSILPNATPKQILAKGETFIWRERIIQTIVLVGTSLAVLAFLVLFPSALINQQFSQALGFTASTAALVLFLVFGRRLPFWLRSIVLLLVIFGASLASFNQNALSGNGRIFLISFVALAAILFGLRGGIYALVLSLATMVFYGYSLTSGLLPMPSSEDLLTSTRSSEWIISTIFLIVATTIIITSQNTLVSGLQAGLKRLQSLTTELERERTSLEDRVQTRTGDLERRLTQIRAASEISRSISGVLDPQTLLQQVVDQIRESFDLYYVGLFLIDEKKEFAVLQAGTGDAGQQMIANQHKLSIGGSSMIGWATTTRKARIALDVGADPVHFNNPNLPFTRSEMALPIISRDSVLGALSIQSSLPNAFDENDILILQSIADSLAVALENARLFQQTQQTLEEIQSLNRTYLHRAWEEVEENYTNLQYTYQPAGQPGSNAPETVTIPLLLRDQPIGQLQLEVDKGSLSPEDTDFLEAVSVQTALALENARLLEQTQRRAASEEKVNALTAQFSRATSIEDILRTAVQELGHLPSVSEVSITLIPPDTTPVIGSGNNGRDKEAA